MKIDTFRKKGKIEAKEVLDPIINNPNETSTRAKYSCICGSIFLFYRGLFPPQEQESLIRHEFIGNS